MRPTMSGFLKHEKQPSRTKFRFAVGAGTGHMPGYRKDQVLIFPAALRDLARRWGRCARPQDVLPGVWAKVHAVGRRRRGGGPDLKFFKPGGSTPALFTMHFFFLCAKLN